MNERTCAHPHATVGTAKWQHTQQHSGHTAISDMCVYMFLLARLYVCRGLLCVCAVCRSVNVCCGVCGSVVSVAASATCRV